MKPIRLVVISICLLLFGLQPVFSGEAAVEPLALLAAKTLPNQTDVAQYWVSEKLDGVHAYWDGKKLHFRSGRLVTEPAWFTANFPAQPLDGELWFDRGGFDHLSGIVRKLKPIDEEWRQVRYMLFELPDAPGTFSERIKRMNEIVKAANIPWLQTIEQFRVHDRKALQQQLSVVLKKNGEGLMLHRADALYTTDRDDVLFKLKLWLDADATVIEHLPGQGKYEGMLGALLLKTPDGRRFKLGTGFSDEERRTPPAVGTLITYRYRELNKSGLPRFASYLRVREVF